MASYFFTIDGFMFILRWLHFFFGVMWIGHLYYFNFVQGAAMAEADAATKSGILTKLAPKALWWFRWGAMWTVVTGVLYMGLRGHQAGMEIYSGSWGISILIGAILGITMFANVWLVIWPNQKIVIGSATQVANGGTANPAAAAAGARALLASRTNTMFSIPMLFFMGAASHLPLPVTPESNTGLMWVVLAILLLILEGNAIKGKLGPIQTVKGVITAGFVLTFVIFLVLSAFL